MYPKLVFMDLEGTLLRKAYHLDNGKVAPSSWTLLAEKLGPDALNEEEETKSRWKKGYYRNYIEWMEDTIRIHQKYGLTRNLFERVMNSVEEMPGIREAIKIFHKKGALTAIISGAFKPLADRIQRALRVSHALCGCEYFFDPKTGLLEHWNLLPSDYEGKVDFMRLIMKEHHITSEDCAFIGDGMNDVPLALEVGVSIAFNAQPELKEVCTYVIDQAPGQENFMAVAKCLEKHARFKKCHERNETKMLDAHLKRKLVAEAKNAREAAYAPYSGDFKVGAAVLTEDGEIFSGCNVENASFGATVCAERVAVFKAIAAGKRHIKALAVIAESPEPIPPCGICRQVIAEFGPKSEIVMANIAGEIKTANLQDLLPSIFEFHSRGHNDDRKEK